jgi:hypothetical protein
MTKQGNPANDAILRLIAVDKEANIHLAGGDRMKRFGWVAVFMAVNLYGCVTAVAPKYELMVSKERKQLPLNEFCSLRFTFINTRNSAANPWIEALILDAENNTVDGRFVTFATAVAGEANQQETIIYASCNRIRQVAIIANDQIVEPNTFAWNE